LEDIVEKIVLLAGIALFSVAAYGDARTFKIPNKLVIAVAVLGALRLIIIGDPSVAIHTAAITAIVFIGSLLLFWRNFIGGGDAKLITATALLIGYNSLFNFLLVMSVCGALVSLVVLVMYWASPQPKAALAVPYGVAIAGGAIVTLLFQPSLFG
jgi:prepilin peptidase CpaA